MFVIRRRTIALFAAALAFAWQSASALADPLPSWNSGDTKSAIIEFVEATTKPGSDAYVDPAERIATFDNDGNLWAEQPFYFQIAYAIDEAKKMVAADLSFPKIPSGLWAA